MNRRLLLMLLVAPLLAAVTAHADGGKGGGGKSGPGGGGGGGDGGGGDGGGDGGNSGHGGGEGGDGGDGNDGGGGDQYDARSAVDSGKAAKLNVVLKTVRARVPGDVVDVKLRHGSGGLTYRIKVLDQNGSLVTVTVDATTGRVLRIAGGS
jgi:Peptidase propeptide and YPEB domain